jgi:hypothetical protein
MCAALGGALCEARARARGNGGAILIWQHATRSTCARQLGHVKAALFPRAPDCLGSAASFTPACSAARLDARHSAGASDFFQKDKKTLGRPRHRPSTLGPRPSALATRPSALGPRIYLAPRASPLVLLSRLAPRASLLAPRPAPPRPSRPSPARKPNSVGQTESK